VSNCGLGVVDNNRLSGVRNLAVVVVVVLDGRGHIGLLAPLRAVVTTIAACRYAGRVRLVHGGHGDRWLAVAWSDGGIPSRLGGSARGARFGDWGGGVLGCSISSIAATIPGAVGVVGSCSAGEDECVLHGGELIMDGIKR